MGLGPWLNFDSNAPLKYQGKKWFAFSKMDIGAAEMLARLESR